MANADVFLQVYKDVMQGDCVSPRGSLCHEVCDYSFVLDMNDNPFTSFRARNLNERYAKEEFLWYLRADKFDVSIEEHASLWAKIRQPDGSFYSNYGQYIFPKQFGFVVEELRRDPSSRRASIVLLKPEHLFHENKDVVCTYAMNFRIRKGVLHMTVMMRSNDVIFGMTNDVFCFSMIYRMVAAMLVQWMPIEIGTYRHFVNSLHVYERHFDMIKQLVDVGMSGYSAMLIPWPSPHEVAEVLHKKFEYGAGPWMRWLLGPT